MRRPLLRPRGGGRLVLFALCLAALVVVASPVRHGRRLRQTAGSLSLQADSASASAQAGFTLQTAPTTEILFAAMMPDYTKIPGLSGTRAMFLGREATGKFFVSEVDLENMRSLSFNWMQDLGLPVPPDVTILCPAGSTRRVAFPVPLGPEETVYLSDFPSLLKNVSGDVRLVTGVQALLQGNLTAGASSELLTRYNNLKRESANAKLSRLEKVAGMPLAAPPMRRRRMHAGEEGGMPAEAVAVGLTRSSSLGYRDLMGGAMEYAEVLLDPRVHGYPLPTSGGTARNYSADLAITMAQKIILQSTAFTGKVRNVQATALFANMYFANFYTNRQKTRYGWLPGVLHADLLRYAVASGVFGVSDARSPPRGASFARWETYQRKAFYYLTLGGIGCAFEDDYVVESPSGQASPGGSVDSYDVQYYAFEGRGMGLWQAALVKPKCIKEAGGCVRPLDPKGTPSPSVLAIVARLRGLDEAKMPLDGLATPAAVRFLYTGQGAVDAAVIDDAEDLASGGGGTTPLSSVSDDAPVATPPPTTSAFSFYTSGTGLVSSTFCFGTSLGGGSCGGISSAASYATYVANAGSTSGDIYATADQSSPAYSSALGVSYPPTTFDFGGGVSAGEYCCCGMTGIDGACAATGYCSGGTQCLGPVSTDPACGSTCSGAPLPTPAIFCCCNDTTLNQQSCSESMSCVMNGGTCVSYHANADFLCNNQCGIGGPPPTPYCCCVDPAANTSSCIQSSVCPTLGLAPNAYYCNSSKPTYSDYPTCLASTCGSHRRHLSSLEEFFESSPPPPAPAPRPQPPPSVAEARRRRRLRGEISAYTKPLDVDFINKTNWYMPAYSLRYCPGSGALSLPMDVFSPPVVNTRGTDFLEFPGAFTSLLPTGYSTSPFPMYPPTLFKSWVAAYPPVPSLQTVVVDPRTAPSDPSSPLRLRAIVRYPLFPDADTLGLSDDDLDLLSDPEMRADAPLAGTVAHLTVRLSWLVYAPTDNSSKGSAKLEEAIALDRTDIAFDDAFIVQNAMPRYASGGTGALEGRYVESAKHALYVVGDRLIRLRRPSSALGGESSLGGAVRDSVPLSHAKGWRPTKDHWYSVVAAAYQDGALFVVRERMEAPEGPGLASDGVDADYTGRKIDFSSDYAQSAQLLKIFNVDNGTVGPIVQISGFTPNVRGVLVPEGNNGTARGYGTQRLYFHTRKHPEVFAVVTNCAPGKYYSHAEAGCASLPGGYASSRAGLLNLTEAAVCRENYFAPEGSVACTKCPKGRFAEPGSSACTDCPQNTFGLEEGAGCTPCANNTYTPSLAWTSACLKCPAGQYLPQPGLSFCFKCPAYEFSAAGALGGCEDCPLGSIPTSAADGCDECPAGTFQPAPRTPCTVCPAGTYSSGGAHTTCSLCPNGTIPSGDRKQCTPCPPGTSRPASAADCSPCPQGTYSDKFGLPACPICRPGTVSRDDRLGCAECPAGATPSANRSVCEACPPRTYSEEAGWPACRPCEAGHVTDAGGTGCNPCEPGTYLPGSAPRCLQCPLNSVSAEPAATKCAACGPGTVSDPTFTFCDECSPGTYRSNATQEFCYPCPWGTYAGDFGASACLKCSPDQFCPLATADPLSLSSIGDDLLDEEAPAATAARRARRTLFATLLRRGLRAASDTDSNTVTYGLLNVTTTEPTIKDESEANDLLNRRFIVIGLTCLGVMGLVGGLFYVWIYFFPAAPGSLGPKTSKRARKWRAKKIGFLHYFYREDGGRRTISGAFFSMLGGVAVVVAVSFSIAQQVTANFIVTQSLNPGVSPSLASIQGEFAVSAAFVGYTGPCHYGPNSNASDVKVTPSGITAPAGSAPVIKAARPVPGACAVSWACKSCKLASRDVSVGTTVLIELVPPWNGDVALAMSSIVQFVVRLPSETSINGSATTSSPQRIFRGPEPVRLPVQLTAVHFSDDAAKARYKPGVVSPDNTPAEIEETTFRPDLRAQNRVAFRAELSLGANYLLVDTKTKNSVIDFLSGLYALALAAFDLVAQGLAAYLFALAYMRKRRVITGPVLDAVDDFGEDDAVEIGEKGSGFAGVAKELGTPGSEPSSWESGTPPPSVFGGRRHSAPLRGGPFDVAGGETSTRVPPGTGPIHINI